MQNYGNAMLHLPSIGDTLQTLHITFPYMTLDMHNMDTKRLTKKAFNLTVQTNVRTKNLTKKAFQLKRLAEIAFQLKRFLNASNDTEPRIVVAFSKGIDFAVGLVIFESYNCYLTQSKFKCKKHQGTGSYISSSPISRSTPTICVDGVVRWS